MLILENYCIFFHSRMPLWVRKGKQNLLLLQNSVGCNFFKSLLNLRKLKLANTIVYDAKQTKAYPIITDLMSVVKEETKHPVADVGLPFTIGDIVWAHIPGYPLCPSVITAHPLENLYTKTGSMVSHFWQ